MQLIRNWCGRYSLQLILVGLGLGAAWTLKQTQGEVLIETYRSIAQPFRSEYNSRQILENAQMLELQYRITEIEQQNQNLRKLLKVTPLATPQGIWAGVIGRSADAWWQQLVIDRGTNQGVKKGAIALADGGLAGRVTNVYGNSSRVLLLSDPTAQVGVTISRTRNMGILRGLEQNLGVLSFFERDPGVKPGDIVVTSPHSGLFPPGIPVGRVRSVNLNRQPAPEAIVEFAVPLAQLEYVKILPFTPAE
jgi:rod shape-determining protein MreC